MSVVENGLNRRIKVMHIVTRMIRGGAQEVVLDLVEGLDPSIYDVVIVYGPPEGPEGSLEDRVHRSGTTVFNAPSLVREISPVKDLRALNEITRICRTVKPDLVHTHTSKAGILGRVAARRAKVPSVVHTPHGHVFFGYYGKFMSRMFVLIERWCARYADVIVMITRNELTDHVAEHIAPESKFVIIPSGVNLKPLLAGPDKPGQVRRDFGIAPDARVIGTMGRLVPIKGQVHLVDAMPKVIRAMPDAHLILVGNGNLEQSLKDRARVIGVEDRVHFTGYRSDIANCLSAMDLFALPSINEGMGRVLIEAMAMKLPVVASNVCGIRDLITQGENGYLVPPADPDSIAEAIIEILKSPDRAKEMGLSGYKLVDPEYSLEVMLVRTDSVYKSLYQKNSR